MREFNSGVISKILRDWGQSPIGTEQGPEGLRFLYSGEGRPLYLDVNWECGYVEFGGGILEGNAVLRNVTGFSYSKKDDGDEIRFVSDPDSLTIKGAIPGRYGIIFTLEGGHYTRVVPIGTNVIL